MDGRRRRVAALRVHLQAAEEAPNDPVCTSNHCVDHVGQVLAGARLVEERVRVDADTHALARVGNVARAALRREVEHAAVGILRVVKHLEALLARVVRRRQRVAPAQPVAVGVGQALDHVARPRDRVARLLAESGRKVAALRGAVELAARDAVALQEPVRIVVQAPVDVAAEVRRHRNVALAADGAVGRLGQLALVADLEAKGERRLVAGQRALEQAGKRAENRQGALRAALGAELEFARGPPTQELVAALLLGHVFALHKLFAKVGVGAVEATVGPGELKELVDAGAARAVGVDAARVDALVDADAVGRVGRQQLLGELGVGGARVDVRRPARAKVFKHHLLGGVPAAVRAVGGHPGVGRRELAAAARVLGVGLHGERRRRHAVGGGRGAQRREVRLGGVALLLQLFDVLAKRQGQGRHRRVGRRVHVEALERVVDELVPLGGVSDVLLGGEQRFEVGAADEVGGVRLLQQVGDDGVGGGDVVVGLGGGGRRERELQTQAVGRDAAVGNHLLEQRPPGAGLHQENEALRAKLLALHRLAGGDGVVLALVVAVEELYRRLGVGGDAVGGGGLVAELAVEHLGVVVARLGLQPAAF